MKPIFLFLCGCFFLVASLSGQDSTDSPPPPPAPGPGLVLPEHSKPQTFDLSGLQKRSLAFSDQIRESATELFTLFAILALIWTGYHAQFRGLHEFVGTLLHITLTSTLIINYKGIVPILIQSRDALLTQLHPGTFDITAQLGAALANVGATIGVMSLTGLAAGFALFGIVIMAVVIYSMQLLFEAVLIGFGPFAVAALAFSHSRGIFTMWFKTLIAVALVPVGWLLGANFFSAIAGIDPASTTPIKDLLATIIYIAGFGAIYTGMPFIMVWIVNSASGAAAAAMPTLVSAVTGVMANGSGLGKAVFSSATAVGTASTTMTTSAITSVPALSTTAHFASASSGRTATNYEERIMAAQKVREEIHKTTPPKNQS